LKFGKWHAGQWGAGKPVLKVLWRNHNNQVLSSGFLLLTESGEIDEILAELSERAGVES